MVERIAFTQSGLERGARRLDDLVGRAEERARLPRDHRRARAPALQEG